MAKRQRHRNPFDRPSSRPRRIRALILGSGIGVTIGFDTAGFHVVQTCEADLSRELLLHNDISVDPIPSLSQAALTALNEKIDVLAGYAVTPSQKTDMAVLAGASRPEWVVLIWPVTSEKFDIRPHLWRYGYGITSTSLRACDYGTAEQESYHVIVARKEEREDFLLESLVDRALKPPTPPHPPRHDLDPLTRVARRKGLPKDLKWDIPGDVLAIAEGACPPLLAYHVAVAVQERHQGLEIPEPERAKYNSFILGNSNLDPNGRTIKNFYSRVTRARRLLGGRTYRDHTAELADLDRAIDEFNAKLKQKNRGQEEKKREAEIKNSVRSDLRKALTWEYRMCAVRQRQRDKELARATLPPTVVGLKIGPFWLVNDLQAGATLPPLPPVEGRQPTINFNRVLTRFEEDFSEEDLEDDGCVFDENIPLPPPPPKPAATSIGVTKGIRKKDNRGRKAGMPTRPKHRSDTKQKVASKQKRKPAPPKT